ncbi:Nuclear control of ATPase protein 2, partial [Frankliniella fusca]
MVFSGSASTEDAFIERCVHVHTHSVGLTRGSRYCWINRICLGYSEYLENLEYFLNIWNILEYVEYVGISGIFLECLEYYWN